MRKQLKETGEAAAASAVKMKKKKTVKKVAAQHTISRPQLVYLYATVGRCVTSLAWLMVGRRRPRRRRLKEVAPHVLPSPYPHTRAHIQHTQPTPKRPLCMAHANRPTFVQPRNQQRKPKRQRLLSTWMSFDSELVARSKGRFDFGGHQQM